VRRAQVALLMIAWLRGTALAGPEVAAPATHDPIGAVRASEAGSPWIDLAPATVLEAHAADDREGRADHRLAAAVAVTGLYVGFTGWTYLAWYRKHKALSDFKWGGDGWLGSHTYAGGADKFGHAWATMSLARLGTEMLDQWGGFDRSTAAIVGTALAETLFLGVEIKDGFYYEFSFSDATGDTVGALAAYALSRWPRLDELFDYRVEYFPSRMYLRKLDGSSPCPTGTCSTWNVAEDYSGETYLLALHLGGIHALRDLEYGTLSRFVDLTLGFDTRNYKPNPDPVPMVSPHQDVFIGISLNAQGLFDYLLEGKPSAVARRTRKVTHGLFEVFNVPFSSAPLLQYEKTPTGPIASGGA
jgi:hypothetical protein